MNPSYTKMVEESLGESDLLGIWVEVNNCLGEYLLLPKYGAEMENVCHVQIPQLTSSVGQET